MDWLSAEIKLPPYRYSWGMEIAAVVFLLVVGSLATSVNFMPAFHLAGYNYFNFITVFFLITEPCAALLACFAPRFGAVWLTLCSLWIIPALSFVLNEILASRAYLDIGISDYFAIVLSLLALTLAAWYLRRLRRLKVAAGRGSDGDGAGVDEHRAQWTWGQGLSLLIFVLALIFIIPMEDSWLLFYLLPTGAVAAGLFIFLRKKMPCCAGKSASPALGGALLGMSMMFSVAVIGQLLVFELPPIPWITAIGTVAGYLAGALIGRMFAGF